ncbi:MAG: permease [Methanomassiliicoccales archaeon]|nr:permease [Methanomassiliicoccales archaeon]NYT14921.1 permease [Methanomassiliicoccales archaeon]
MLEAIIAAFVSGIDSVLEYLSAHVLTCLVPAFFIAGAIGAFIKKDIILKYFGPITKRWISFGLASISGSVLAVCSCTIIPLFAGIYKKGSGIGPATTFLFAGPAINVLAIIYTAQVLGYELGLARAVAAIFSAILLGLIMSMIFKKHDRDLVEKEKMNLLGVPTQPRERPKWVVVFFFILLICILIFGASGLDPVIKLMIIYALTVALALLLIYFFKKDEVTDWGYETWDLTKKILPILIIGTFIVGVIAYFLPPETFQPYLGDNSLPSVFLASLLGVILYMPTLLEVPIIGTTFGFTSGIMANGPALALLLSGPTISLPSIIVLNRIMGGRKTLVYVLLTLLLATISGMIYGGLTG